MLVLGWTGVSLTVWIIGVQGPGSGANAIVLPSTHTCTPTHTHTGAQAGPDHCRPRQSQAGSQTGPLNLTPRAIEAAQRRLGASSSRRRLLQVALRPLPRRGLHPVPPTHALFQEYCLTFAHVPRVSYFLLLLALQGASCAILLCLVQASIKVSRMLFSPSKLSNPKPKKHLGRPMPQLAVCHAMPPCHAMRCHATHMHAPVLPAAAQLAMSPPLGPEDMTDMSLSWRSDISS